jgi:MarR family transcriptional regulator, organic hydroperoxide resistance regulator
MSNFWASDLPGLQISNSTGYDDFVPTFPSRSKRAVAADVWRLMGECAVAQFGKAAELLQPLGLTPGHAKLLMRLDEANGQSMGALAQSFRCDASTMTWLVDRLEERGLVERRGLPTDRRVKAVGLTPLGVETKAQLMERMYEPPDQLVALDREALLGLRAALNALWSSDHEPQRNTTEPDAETASV